MSERLLVESLDAFHREVREKVKGVKSEMVWCLYGAEADYVLEGDPKGEGTLEERGWTITTEKQRRDWETYLFYNSGGMLSGHSTGRAERGGRAGWTGKIEEASSRQYVHQILPAEFAALVASCRVREEGLLLRHRFLQQFPLLASCHLFFFEYLRAVYRILSADEETVLHEALAARAEGFDMNAFRAAAARSDEAAKGERRPCAFEVDAGRIRVFAGTDKRSRRCINGWIWGEAAEEEKAEGPAEAGEGETAYEERIRGAAFHVRVEALWQEAAALQGFEDAAEVFDLAVRARAGRAQKAFDQVDDFGDTLDVAALPQAKRGAIRALHDRVERDARLVSAHGRILLSWGADLREHAKRVGPQLLKLKRKLTAAGA